MHHVVVLVLLSLPFRVVSVLPAQVWIDYANATEFPSPHIIECFKRNYCSNDVANRYLLGVTEYFNIPEDLGPINTYGQNCGCSEHCYLYSECCEDASHAARPPLHQFSCTKVEASGSEFYMVSQCPSGWPDENTRSLCDTPMTQDVSSAPDISEWIVTALTQNITYQNMYCALCNGEPFEELYFWELQIGCSFAPLPLPPGADINNDTMVADVVQKYKYCDFKLQLPYQFVHRCANILVKQTPCAPDYEDMEVVNQCNNGSLAPVKLSSNNEIVFRNMYCALCNHHYLTDLSCNIAVAGGRVESGSLRLLIHPFTVGCQDNSVDSLKDAKACQDLDQALACGAGETFDWSTQTCLPFCHGETLIWSDGRCLVKIERQSSQSISVANSTCSNVSHSQLISMYSREQLTFRGQLDNGLVVTLGNQTFCTSCVWVTYALKSTAMNNEDLLTLDNFVIKPPLFFTSNDSSVRVCYDHAASEYLLHGQECLRAEGTVTQVLLSISMACLLCTIIIYLILPILRNVPGRLVLNEAIAMLIADLCFIVRSYVSGNEIACYLMAVLTLYFFICYTFWTFLLAVEIVRTVTAFYSINSKSTRKIVRYSLIGWFAPLIPVIITVVLDHVDLDPQYAPQLGQPSCWFNTLYGVRFYFLVPIGAHFAVNLIIYLVVVVRFAVLAYQTRKVTNTHLQKLILSIKFFFAFGLLWVFGLSSAIVSNNRALSCIFVSINSSNGILLFVIFVLTKPVLKGLRNHKFRSAGPDTKSDRLKLKTISTPMTHTVNSPSTHRLMKQTVS